MKRWVEKFLNGNEQALALDRLADVRKRARHSPRAYPPDYVLKAMMGGAYKRQILPKGK